MKVVYRVSLLVIVGLYAVMLVYGCSAMHSAMDRYNSALKSPEHVSMMRGISESSQDLARSLGVDSGLLPAIGVVVSFVTGLLLGKKKKRS